MFKINKIQVKNLRGLMGYNATVIALSKFS